MRALFHFWIGYAGRSLAWDKKELRQDHLLKSRRTGFHEQTNAVLQGVSQRLEGVAAVDVEFFARAEVHVRPQAGA